LAILPTTTERKRTWKTPTQKASSLVEQCILASTKEGDRILDPFMGAGTTGVACVMNRRRFIGIELDMHHVQLAKQRIQGHVTSFGSFTDTINQKQNGDGKLSKSLKQWLNENNYNDVAELIAEVSAEWAEQGKKTRRNWWDILAGDLEGNPRVVDGRTFQSSAPLAFEKAGRHGKLYLQE